MGNKIKSLLIGRPLKNEMMQQILLVLLPAVGLLAYIQMQYIIGAILLRFYRYLHRGGPACLPVRYIAPAGGIFLQLSSRCNTRNLKHIINWKTIYTHNSVNIVPISPVGKNHDCKALKKDYNRSILRNTA
jgi:hypothetical protein